MRANCLPGRSCNASFLSLEGARNCARMHACAHTPSNLLAFWLLGRYYARMHACMHQGSSLIPQASQHSPRIAARESWQRARCRLSKAQLRRATLEGRGARAARASGGPSSPRWCCGELTLAAAAAASSAFPWWGSTCLSGHATWASCSPSCPHWWACTVSCCLRPARDAGALVPALPHV